MNWIKKNYDRFVLLLLAVALLASSAFMIWLTHGFSERFGPVLASVTKGHTVKSLETEALEQAKASLSKPTAWGEHPAHLYVSCKYVAQQDAGSAQKSLINPFLPGSKPIHPPVPNEWFLKHGLEDQILDADVLQQDPDKDGFTNLDEYNGQTDPQDPASHPPYLTKLRLESNRQQPNRFLFGGTDEDGSFQINTKDVNQPTQFVKVGDQIPGTKFKVVKFEKKSAFNKSTNENVDVSELTVEHTETGVQTPLVIGVEKNIPDLFARFVFLWDNSKFSVKKEAKFALKPEPNIEYKLIDINQTEAVIVNANGGDPIKVPHVE